MDRRDGVVAEMSLSGFLRRPTMRDPLHPASWRFGVARVERSGTRDLRRLIGRSRVPRCALHPGYFVPGTFTATCAMSW